MMTIDSNIIAFTGVAAVLIVTPGADTMLVMRSVLAHGQRAGLLTTFGICSGLFIHATLSAAGLSLILMRSGALFETVKLIGAGYLVFLGGQSLWRALRRRNDKTKIFGADDSIIVSRKKENWRSYCGGLFTNLLNPKVAIFYLAFLPQFISPSDSVLAKSILLVGIHFILSMMWLSLVTLFIGKIRVCLIRPRVQRAIEATTGTVLIAFGARLAAASRR